MPKTPQLINVTSQRETNRGTTAIAFRIDQRGRYQTLNISTRDGIKKKYWKKLPNPSPTGPFYEQYTRTIKKTIYSINSRAYWLYTDGVQVDAPRSDFYGNYPTYSKALHRVKELIKTKGNGTEKDWLRFKKIRLKMTNIKIPTNKKRKKKPTTELVRQLEL